MTAAAKGTKLQGEGVRKIFVGILAASSALRLGAEATEGALRAVEQIMSKGVVQAEELRGQLGERIPGAFKLSAEAVEKTTSELNEMLKAGELLATDLLPKLGDVLIKAFSEEGLRAAKTLNGALQNLETTQFIFNRTLDQTTGASDAAVGAINRLIAIIQSLSNNLGIILPILGALAIGLIARATPAIFAGIVRLIGLMGTLNVAILGARFASIGLALGLVGAAVAGIAAYIALRKSITDVTSVQDILNDRIGAFIAAQKESGKTISQQATLFIAQTQAQINANKIQVQGIADFVSSFSMNNSNLKQFFAMVQGGVLDVVDAIGVGGLFKPEERVGLLDAIREMQRLGKETKGLQLFLVELDKILKSNAESAEDMSKAFSKAKDKIKDIREELTTIEEIGVGISANKSSAVLASFKDFREGVDLLKDVTKPEELEAMRLVLAGMGFEAGTAAQALGLMITALRKGEDAISAFEKRGNATAGAMRKFTDALNETNLEIRRLSLGPGKALEEFDKAQARAEAIDAMGEALSRTNLSLSLQNDLLAVFKERLEVLDVARKKFEDLEKIVDAVRSGIERAFDRIGESITEAFVKGEAAALNFQSVVEGIISEIAQAILKFTIIDPISKFVTGALGDALGSPGGGGGGSTLFTNAEFFGAAKGTVLKKPTLFGAANGLVLGGEAGEEGLLPLKRTSSGDLGVNATGLGGGGGTVVNVFAPAGSQVETKRRRTQGGGETIDVIIDKSVARAIRGRGETRGAMEEVFVIAGRTASR